MFHSCKENSSLNHENSQNCNFGHAESNYVAQTTQNFGLGGVTGQNNSKNSLKSEYIQNFEV